MRTLVIDIETSPIVAYVWGLRDQNIGLNQVIEPTRVLCAAWQFDDEPMQFAAEWKRGGHDGMVANIRNALVQADVVVHYNGTSFDVPHLNREFLELGLDPPSPYKQVDLYRQVRRAFKFPSNKLEYISKALDVAGGKMDTGGMSLWIKVLAGDKEAQALMQSYNEQDVVVTKELHERIKPWIIGGPNPGLYVGDNVLRCTSCGSHEVQRRGFSYTTAGKYPRFQCTSCGKWSRGASRLDTTPLRESL